jgi:hypothetical protein
MTRFVDGRVGQIGPLRSRLPRKRPSLGSIRGGQHGAHSDSPRGHCGCHASSSPQITRTPRQGCRRSTFYTPITRRLVFPISRSATFEKRSGRIGGRRRWRNHWPPVIQPVAFGRIC